MEIAERLREARKNAGLTQDQVAEMVSVSRVTVSHWETGKSLPDIASLIGLSDLYAISLDELVRGDSKVEDKVKRDSRNAKANARLIGTTSVIVAVVLVVYAVSMFVGGDFKDFCDAAVMWVLAGIGVAGYMVYASQKEPK